MDAWGLGLFQSFLDLDLIFEFDHELGLYELARKAEEHDGAESNSRIYSIKANLCYPKEAVDSAKKLLENGRLAELVARYEAKMQTGDDSDVMPPGYKLSIIGACAMTLGCHLEPSFINLLKRIYPKNLQMPDSNMQMTKALFGPNGYTNGVSYDFGGKSFKETMNSGGPPKDVQAQFGLPPWFGPARKMRSPTYTEPQYPDDVCGGCGKDENAGMGPLMKCACCKNRVYCSKECQKYHWKWHKVICRPA
ncbi:hypothetical protein KC332_g11702 [Hortaea werneckii]|uniref:MYND-type domain-containing protein n=1 Tax=Hortaea werneckii TaxID=91943 RepID=A0A3M7H7R4_HORWE|nr:hypothetical protein KC350_g18195 [Hortaea werneckii]KAI6789578.1 hypothetical protein KC358_g18179 [Hortaea werneckii]KAI6914322.1 hypothetical protein KC348_g12267 [Hortaea werneckii]KAI6927868.1 hypothetical protein KC341_g11879 [Hortaea werneckii]KAI6951344.1 hypothetical protein KC321_g18124 [Hortaea werneckii]